jgi:hypothetical protein
MPNK